MKTTNIIKAAAAAVVCLWSTACNDAKNPPLNEEYMVYISEAAASKGGNLVLSSDGVSTTTFTLRMNRPAERDVTVTLGLRAENLNEYNSMMQTSYVCIDEENVLFDNEVTIPAGSVTSDIITVSVQPFTAEGGKSYAIPLQIVSCDGARITERSSKYTFELVKEIGLRPAATFQSTHSGTVLRPYAEKADGTAGEGTWGMQLSAFTIEFWVCPTVLNINNQVIVVSGGDVTNFYCRFGDVTYGNDYRYLQIKVQGADQGFDTGDPKTTPLTAGRWYHFAVTYTASDAKYTLYQDGVKVDEHTAVAGQLFNMNQMTLCNSSNGSYQRNNIHLAEFRVWKTARSETQIRNYMYIAPRYDDPNLIAYLPLNEGPGSDTFIDVTGNGHDAPQHNGDAANPRSMGWTTIDLTSSK